MRLVGLGTAHALQNSYTSRIRMDMEELGAPNPNPDPDPNPKDQDPNPDPDPNPDSK